MVSTRCDDRAKHRCRRRCRIRPLPGVKTVEPERGDYYLKPGGEPTPAPGRWLADEETLARLGIKAEPVEGSDFVALMEGRDPRSGSGSADRARMAAGLAGSI